MYTEKELESEEDDVDEEGQEYLKMLAKKVRCWSKHQERKYLTSCSVVLVASAILFRGSYQ